MNLVTIDNFQSFASKIFIEISSKFLASKIYCEIFIY